MSESAPAHDPPSPPALAPGGGTSVCLRTVILRHEVQGPGSHWDWLTQRSQEPDTQLISFRVSLRPDDPEVRAFDATRLPDHRSLYLDYQGPLSGHRGIVRRVAAGTAQIILLTDEAMEIACRFAGPIRLWHACRVTSDRWAFSEK